MIKSMTGYGRGKAMLHGRDITVEIRSVNHKYFDCTVKAPRIYGFLEEPVKNAAQDIISRGKVDIYVSVDSSQSGDVQIVFNETILRQYVDVVSKIQKLYSLPDDISAQSLLKLPDVVSVKREDADAQELTDDVLSVMSQALSEFDKMRSREGQKLCEDLLQRAQLISSFTDLVEERSPATVSEYRVKIEQRIRELIEGVNIDPQRILTEAAIFADKVSVTEEIVRLKSHLSQLGKMLQSDLPTGRKLDFLVQELNREANTIGSKANDYEIAQTVIDLKSEIGKIREQVQNIE